MGISINYAASTWKKESKSLYRPFVSSTFQESSSLEDFYEFYHLFNEHGGLVYMGDFIDSHFSTDKFTYYVERSNEFLEAVASTNTNTPLYQWFLSQKGNLIHFDYDQFLSSPHGETFFSNKWTPSNFIPLQEDGKLLMSAISNFDSLYGVSLSPILISQDTLDDYIETSDNGNHLDNLITADKTYLADVLEFTLANAKKMPHDIYYEDRNLRLQSLVEPIRSGAKFVYSV